MYRYLKDDQYYIDRYDLHTIEECLSYYNGIEGKLKKGRAAGEFKKLNDKEFARGADKAASYVLNIIKAKRYERKKEVIQEWKERDRKVQEKFDNAVPPKGVLCKKCSYPTEVFSKDLHNPYGENSRTLFLYECPKCTKRQALYEDGTERKLKKQKCPKCNHPLDEKSTYTKDILTTAYSCPSCSYKDKETYDFGKSEKENKDKEARERKLLEEYREEFCVSDEIGEQMLRTYEFLSKLYNKYKEKERRKKNPLIQQVKKIKKLTVNQLKKLIRESIEKEV
jgi:DNA-directed RNA polymerase subunit RPC12/RpoP